MSFDHIYDLTNAFPTFSLFFTILKILVQENVPFVPIIIIVRIVLW